MAGGRFIDGDKCLNFFFHILLILTPLGASVVPPPSPSRESSPIATDIRGPGSQSKIVGPDGSVIESRQPGGRILHEETPGIFEPAGRFLGPVLDPGVPGAAAHKAVDTVAGGTAGAGHYAVESVKEGTMMGSGN